MGNGNTGLKGQFGVGDPKTSGQDTADAKDTGSDKQAQDFQAAFQQEQGLINGHLQYTAVNAEASRHDPLAARRDAMFGAFQSALAKIDRKDASKAQAGIDKVLADARALSGEAAAFRQQAEKAKVDWDSRQGKYDEAVHQVEELEAWEDAKAPALRGLVDGIRKQVNLRQYAQSTTTLDQLLPKLKTIYEEYLRQKEAKPQYEQQVAEQSARLEPLKAAERPSQPMTAKAGEADAALQEAPGKADAKNYVAGLEGLAKAKALLDELDTLTNDPQRQQYLADTQDAQQTSEPQPEPAFKTLEADWTAISEGGTQAEPLAESGDYTGANQALADSKAKRAEFQRKHDELVQHKKSYEDALAQLQPRLQAAASGPQYAKLQPLQAGLASSQTQMESAAQTEDFGQALTQVQELTTKLEAYEKAKTEIDQKKQAYETAIAALQPRLDAVSVSDPAYAKIEPQLQEITQARTTMEASAQAGDYVQANTQLQDLTAKVDAYERAKAEIDKQKPMTGGPGDAVGKEAESSSVEGETRSAAYGVGSVEGGGGAGSTSIHYQYGYKDAIAGRESNPGPRAGDAVTEYKEGYEKGSYEFKSSSGGGIGTVAGKILGPLAGIKGWHLGVALPNTPLPEPGPLFREDDKASTSKALFEAGKLGWKIWAARNAVVVGKSSIIGMVASAPFNPGHMTKAQDRFDAQAYAKWLDLTSRPPEEQICGLREPGKPPGPPTIIAPPNPPPAPMVSRNPRPKDFNEDHP